MFEREAALPLAKRYAVADDIPALDAGKAIAEGDYSVANLKTIFEWKTGGRGRSRLQKNSDAEVNDALWLATIAKERRSAIAVLIGLHGVDVPVASAIITAIYPESFTVIDFRALAALGSNTADRTIGFYLQYLNYCTTKAAEWNLSLRDFDRALWQWSKEQPKMPEMLPVTDVSK
jgi:hypothetical protein